MMELKNRKFAMLLLMVICATISQAAPVSMWNFEGGTETSVVDQVGSNTGYNHGVRDWPAVIEGAWFMSVRTDLWHRLEAPTAGFSVASGTFMWKYRANSYARLDWCDMFTTPLSADGGVNGIRLERQGVEGDHFTIYAGPSNLGQSVDFGYLGVMDGNWHTLALTYEDGNSVKLYVDGVMRLATDIYSASQYTLMNKVVVGNRVNSSPLAGDYDYIFYDSACLEADTIADYTANGYALFCGDPRIPSPPGDFNNDCHVDFEDFSLLSQNWLQCTDPQNVNCIP